jgi:hypothetical protein
MVAHIQQVTRSIRPSRAELVARRPKAALTAHQKLGRSGFGPHKRLELDRCAGAGARGFPGHKAGPVQPITRLHDRRRRRGCLVSGATTLSASSLGEAHQWNVLAIVQAKIA